MTSNRLPEHWPLSALLVGFPVWWLLGVHMFIWPAFAAVMAARLVVRPATIRVPRGFGLWILFLLWMLVSAVGLDGGGVPISFAWRASSYLSMTVFFLYVYNTPRELLPAERVVKILGVFWLIVVAGGWLGVLFPNGNFSTPFERILPANVASDPFVQQLVHPVFAQVHEILGFPLGRPTAPFVYTNDWGSVYALLLPVFVIGWLQADRHDRRIRAYAILAASMVPAFVSLNRGLWLSLFVALGYAATRVGNFGDRARRAFVGITVLGVVLVAFTPLGTLVEARAENQHSNDGRTFLYEESVKTAMESPLVGHGGPVPYEGAGRIIPLVGTQGQFWLVLVSQGFVGTVLFLGFLLRMAMATRRGPSLTFWCHVVLVIGLVQLLVYDMIPVPLHLIFVVVALGMREAEAEAADAASAAGREHEVVA
ncbi:hypothetical protein BH24ACT3_BH24ACT3_05080 [soil metagenome]